jgi:2-polyprenyl-6-methoxyphenol hydroxylase-like FAD-dependent oxidoreductase
MTKHDSLTKSATRSALIAGASFAGLSMAFWLHQLGYRVTIVEAASSLRKGGTPVDIQDGTVDIARRMGILDAIAAHSLAPRPTQFRAPDGSILAIHQPDAASNEHGAGHFEIERDALLDILFKKVEGNVEIMLGDAITSVQDDGAGVHVTFATGAARDFSLVFGCDGHHSALRRMHFGEEASYSRFMGLYFSISVIEKRIVEAHTTQIFSVPGRTVMLNSYDTKTDVVFCFYAEHEIAYDYRDEAQQRQIVSDRFAGLGWHVPALLAHVRDAENFYFDKMSQISMPSWTKGRVALVGDAAYCASPAAGMGGSLAIVGAAALADALRDHPGDHHAAFLRYHTTLAPFIEEVQAGAIAFGLDMFVAKTEDDLQTRNARLSSA